MIIGTGTNYEV